MIISHVVGFFCCKHPSSWDRTIVEEYTSMHQCHVRDATMTTMIDSEQSRT